MRVALLLGVAATVLLAGFVALESRGPDAPPDEDVVVRPSPPTGDASVPPPTRAPVEPTIDVPLVVRDPTTRAPFARAEVEWSLEFDDDPPGRPSATGRGTTDDAGGLVVTAKRAPRVVAVRIGYGGEWARWTRSAHGDASIVVAPTPKIALQVVGEHGPVGDLMVAIGYRTNQNESAGNSQTTGGPESLALFDVPRMGGVKDVEYFATVRMPLSAPLRVPLTLDPPPSAPVTIRLPPTGTVVVRLVGPSGAPWIDPTQVTIEAASVGTSATGATYRSSRDGVAAFPAVGVGVALDVIVFSKHPAPSGAPRKPCVTTRFRIAGPTSAGQTVEATAHVGVPRPSAVGRLVDAAGGPVAGRVVYGQFLGEAFRRLSSPPDDMATTGADGRFRLEFDAEPAAMDGIVRLSTTGTVEGPRTPELELLRAPWTGGPSGRIDVGDVRFVDAPARTTTLVSGRFGWPPGFAFHGGQIWVARRVGGRFDLVSDLRADADTKGRFEVRGAKPDDDRLWLVGAAQGAIVDAAVEFEPGATDVEVRLVETGGLVGDVVLPNGVDGISSLAVTIEGEPTRKWSHEGATVKVGWQGAMFWCDGLRPGVVNVVVRAPGREEVLARVENVEIKAGARTKDPRIAKIDLARLARPVTARVVGTDGKPVAGVAVWSRPVVPRGTKDVYWARGLSGADGCVRRVGFGGTFEFVATARGFASAEARDVAGDATLTLRPARPSQITVRLASTVVSPTAPLELRASLVWCGAEDRAGVLDDERPADPRTIAAVGSVVFGADRTAKFDVADPGRWQAMITVLQATSGGGRGQGLLPRRSTEVVVIETPQKLEIVVDVDPERYAAACRELSK